MLSKTEQKLLELDQAFKEFQKENKENSLEEFLALDIKQRKSGLLDLKLYLKKYHKIESKEASRLLAKISMKDMFFDEE
ncbi:hypothetical protein [Aureivirga sp. CE67]|uniref:hypothetical protein n=1 Tax=Aureivirga sp. CE67 TaxID=1788983 RepID=UPI0018C97818|nr:hypothetical protein [Aureivirga sp. CE67]